MSKKQDSLIKEVPMTIIGLSAGLLCDTKLGVTMKFNSSSVYVD